MEPSEIGQRLDLLNRLYQALRPELITLPAIGYPSYLKYPRECVTDDPPKLLAQDIEITTIDAFLGTYNPSEQRITLFAPNIQKAADLLECREEELRYAVRYHEHAHAALHLGVDGCWIFSIN